jgi:hypothetical protein
MPRSYVEHLMNERFQEGVVLNVDGGKEGEVMDVEIGKVRVVAPGWLSKGDFGIVEMENEGEGWEVKKVQFHNIFQTPVVRK